MVIFHSYVSLSEGIHNDTPLPILNGLEMQWDIYQQYDRGSKFGLGGVHRVFANFWPSWEKMIDTSR